MRSAIFLRDLRERGRDGRMRGERRREVGSCDEGDRGKERWNGGGREGDRWREIGRCDRGQEIGRMGEEKGTEGEKQEGVM